jgi:chemotaxis protein CheY-P-specific phosphatase CheC/chemotaxis signal transduction protein
MSGCGVGLDIVKNVVTGLSGSVEVWSEPGRGTEFQLILPLTLATTSVVLCRSGEALYAISINDIIESLAVTPEMIRWVDGRRMISLRDEILPLVDMEEIFEGKKAVNETRKVIVVFYKDKKIGISITSIEGTDEIVLKNLEKHYRNIPGISGAAILGDGRIALVLDTIGLIGVLKDRLDGAGSSEGGKKTSAARSAEKKEKKSKAAAVKTPPPAPQKVQSEVQPAQPAVRASIKEIFDESFQEAAGSLSQLTGKQMDFHYESGIKLMSPEELINRIQDDMSRPYFGSLIRSSSELRSDVILLVDESDGPGLYELLTGMKPEDGAQGKDDVLMAIGEVNNILSSSFINHVANAVKKEIHPTTPSNRFDMLGALMQAAVLIEGADNKKILCADTVIGEKGRRELRSRMFVITDAEGLAHILEKE